METRRAGGCGKGRRGRRCDAGEALSVSARASFRLGTIADVVAGDPAPQNPEAFAPDGPLFVRMQDVGRDHLNPALSVSTDRLDRKWLSENRLRLFPKGSILIPKSGASVNLNHRAMLATDAYVVSHLAVVIPDRSKVEPDYLFWWSVRYDPRKQIQVTSLPSLKLATLKSAEVLLPSLDEQRWIANILSRSARIEHLRAQAVNCLRKLSPALFVKKFGDMRESTTNKFIELKGLSVSIESGFSCGKSRLIEKESLIHIRPFNIGQNGEIDLMEVHRVPINVAPVSKMNLRTGDILFNNTNSPDLVGKTALIRKDMEAGFSNHVTRIRLNSSRCDSAFVACYIRLMWLNRYFRDRCTQWVNQASYGSRMLEKTPILLPPLDEQHRIAQHLDKAVYIENMSIQAAEIASEFTNSLMSRLISEGI